MAGSNITIEELPKLLANDDKVQVAGELSSRSHRPR